MADEIDTRVTPSFHPDTVRAIDEYDDDTASILAGTEAAFNEAYRRCREAETVALRSSVRFVRRLG